MKRIPSLMLSLLLMLSLAACSAPASEPEKTAIPDKTPYVARDPYKKPEVAEGETLLWYSDGEYYAQGYTEYRIVGFPDEFMEHHDKTYCFDDGPEGARRYCCFGSVLTGKAPVSAEHIVLLCSDGPLAAPLKQYVVIYDVSIDDGLNVALGEPQLCTDVVIRYERASDCEMHPMDEQSPFASDGGGFHLSDSITDGTPYYQAGIVYDRSMLAMENGGDYASGTDSEAAGGGHTDYRWEFMPLQPGESDIVILTGSYNDGPSAVMVHVTVDDALAWSLDWYAEGSVDDAFDVYAVIEGIEYPVA